MKRARGKRLGALTAALLVAASFATGCSGRPRKSKDPSANEPGPKDRRVVGIDLSGGAPEVGRGGIFQMPATRTYTGLVRALERSYEDPLTAGLWVHFGSQGVDFAHAEEIGALLARFRDKKLPVVCHGHGLTNATSWMVLRGCSNVWLSAGGSVDTVGIAAQLVHVKGLLDKLKVNADFLHVGRYKSGPEPLTREEPSEEAKEAMASTLGSMRAAWLEGADSGRPGRDIAKKLEQGPYSPEEAKANGIIDSIGFESEALAEAKRLAKTNFVSPGFGSGTKSPGGGGITEIIRVLAGGDDSPGKPHISVVPAEGAIGMDGQGPLDGPGITAKALTKTLRRLAADDDVKGVVLRIDSPGGSPLASDLIWRELMELRKKKPVVASVGGMAASGGYYIACGAQQIVAERTSIVGSIGVFGGKIVLGEALRQVGVNAVTVPANPDPVAGARAVYLSPFSPWDEPTRERVRAHMQSIYDLFIARIVEARKLPDETVRVSAEGRIWSGTQGLERKLVDEIGGLSKALELVRKLSGLGADAVVSVEGPRDGLLEMLVLDDDASAAEIRTAIARFDGNHALLGVLPLELRAGAAALSPLTRGETALTALPFTVFLR